MPPISDPLHDETLVKLGKLHTRIQDALSYQVPRLFNHTGSVAVHQQYAAELREDIESFRRELEILETFVDDIRSDERRKDIYSQLDELVAQVEQLKKQFRAALLASKRAIDSQARSQRDELFRSSPVASAVSKENDQSGDALMNASAAVTQALRRTTVLMQQELERSVLSTQMLEDSTQTMTVTSDLYSSFSTLLNTSKTLVTALEEADWLDRLLILSSLAFFLLVVAYIIKKRIIDKGLWLAFWWVKYVPLPRAGGSSPIPFNGAATSVLPLVSSDTSASIITVCAAATTAFSTLPMPPETLSALAEPSPTDIIGTLTGEPWEAHGGPLGFSGLDRTTTRALTSSDSPISREVHHEL
ncbi:Sec20-domain-containing protein [Cantharellus anzutake]|uniref:Sec20-domain-containing protein n=1 Tax=Cantharellus anzutake TaxID=1750568 RepID=UPI0019089C32|nr:Sec20-domain-containing protein [Cantharellus anzutake]KAF8325881.1 Sec20-domain-containing protein [Cantharellus anzutake]